MSQSRTGGGETLLRVLIIVALLLLVPLLMMLFALPMMGMMGWWGGGPMGWWWGGGGPGSNVAVSPMWGIGMMLLFLLVLIGIGYVLYRAVTRGSLGDNDQAIEELRTAYARGELSQEEFEQRRDDLEQTK